ncbi:Lrp/AsnC family transcriptional regulator [Denitrificimonas caeni]|uniref:Lrp/AsnC family transcriptional regulator n=1 Tax=Denitrificimonas caeni TaxID=521720 RepID=UPI00196286B3|nr:Lrp/AsnC family transcriptional regulator [Denitrificimonas caeni]
MDDLCLRMLDRFQHDLPICAAPYQAMADELGCTEDDILQRLTLLNQRKALSRVGPVFEHSRAGASTLVALAVPEARIEEVAAQINAFDEVNHNYLREHNWNLWFVLTGPSREHLDQTLEKIEQLTGLTPLDLPMLTAYQIDLGFALGKNSQVPT